MQATIVWKFLTWMHPGDHMSETAIRFKKMPRSGRKKKQKRTKPRVEDSHITRARKHIQFQLNSRGAIHGVNCRNAAYEMRLSDMLKRHLGPRPTLALSIALEQLVGTGDVVHDGFRYRLRRH